MTDQSFRLSAPLFIRGLRVLSNYMDKAEAHAAASNIDSKTLVDARLAPDMANLAGQVQRASDTSKNAIARITGITPPRMDDNETTLAELKDRIAKTIAFIEGVPEASFEGSDAREVNISVGQLKASFTGKEYLLTFAIPNFFFHVTTAHGILRQQGVAIGKADYLGPFA